MILPRILSILILIITGLYLYRCKPEEIILHGEISGLITDTLTNQPLQAVAVKLNPPDDTTSTGFDGKYLFKSLVPGDYNVEVSKQPYATAKRNAIVTAASNKDVNFALHQIQYPEISDTHLDFGFDSTQKSFTITNTGIGKLDYSITTSQDWITVNPNIGAITTAPHAKNVTIDRSGLSGKKHVEWVEMVFHVGRDLVQDTVYVLLNGIMDQDKNYYGIVTIGTQTWMAENLKTGKAIPLSQEQSNNDIIVKWCYDCNLYGGLYNWYEAMQYSPNDTCIIGTTQGVCPVGWHIPTDKELVQLYDFLGHEDAFVKANELGFELQAGGFTYRGNNISDPSANQFIAQGTEGGFWGSLCQLYPGYSVETGSEMSIYTITMELYPEVLPYFCGASFRCIKDP